MTGGHHKCNLCSDPCPTALAFYCLYHELQRSDRRRQRKHRKQARLLDICERDGWRCGICGRKIKKRLLGTSDEMAPTIDHIVPTANGGTNTHPNLQAAHRECNSNRSNIGPAQLRLC